MIESLGRFDNITAAGILARVALAIEDRANPAAKVRLPGEEALRQSLLDEVRRRLRLDVDDQSPGTLEAVGDLLDQEREKLIGPPDAHSALNRLAEKGDLPSDLYQIEIIKNIRDFCGKRFEQEKQLVEQTVRGPDREQHYGPAESPDDPFLISLFAKFFPNKYPLRSFTFLVAGQRRGLILDVHQAWRIYPDLVNVDGATDLVDLLRRFSDAFGVEIELGGKKGHFILTANLPKNVPVKTSLQVTHPTKSGGKPEKRTITVTSFFQKNPRGGTSQAALSTGIDLNRYREALKMKGW